MNNLYRFENMSKELCPITNEEINEIQNFVCDILEDFTKDIPQEILDDNDRWYLRKRICINR